LRQNVEKGIEKFLHKLGTSYTKYFNTRNKRSGSLFQSSFKAAHISSTSKLLRLAVYVSGNSEIHKVSNAKSYFWCSFPSHLERKKSNIVDNSLLTEHFKKSQDFEEYARENILDFQERKQDEAIYIEVS